MLLEELHCTKEPEDDAYWGSELCTRVLNLLERTALPEQEPSEDAEEMRLTLIGQIHELLDLGERFASRIRAIDPDEARRAEGAVAHARRVTGPYNYNGRRLAKPAERECWPTDEMVIRGAEYLHDSGVRFEGDDCTDEQQELAEGVFRAMLAAAPTPEGDPQRDERDPVAWLFRFKTDREPNPRQWTPTLDKPPVDPEIEVRPLVDAAPTPEGNTNA
jgi:hypothetical protein